MKYKLIILVLAFFLLINAVSAIDSSNWTTAKVGYETFKIPPKYENPYSSDFHMYEFDEDIDVFTIRYVNPRIMDLYGYYLMTDMTKKTTQNYGFRQVRNSTISHGEAPILHQQSRKSLKASASPNIHMMNFMKSSMRNIKTIRLSIQLNHKDMITQAPIVAIIHLCHLEATVSIMEL